MKRVSCWILVLCLAACEKQSEGPPPSPIVIYAPGDASSGFASLLGEFTQDTGIPASVKWGSSAEITNAVINKTGVPADILITDNVADIWRAADEGALRPIETAELSEVSELVRDRDSFWTAINVYPARFATRKLTDPSTRVAEMMNNYEFCVLTSENPLSRSLIVDSIHTVGLKEAERGVRRMVAVLESEPFETEQALLDAVESGECPAAIIARADGREALTLHPVDLGPVTIDAVGVGRHSRYPESAQQFVEWLIREHPVDVPDSLLIPVSVAGYRDEEARLLAERAGYR